MEPPPRSEGRLPNDDWTGTIPIGSDGKMYGVPAKYPCLYCRDHQWRCMLTEYSRVCYECCKAKVKCVRILDTPTSPLASDQLVSQLPQELFRSLDEMAAENFFWSEQ